MYACKVIVLSEVVKPCTDETTLSFANICSNMSSCQIYANALRGAFE